MPAATWASRLAGLCCAGLAAMPVGAQELNFLDRTTGYFTIGGGSGSFTMSCGDPACAALKQSSSDVDIAFGRHIGPRFRIELAGHDQKTADNYAISLTAGGAIYLVRGLLVRGGFAFTRPSIDDASGAYTASGKGYIAGVGYDLFLARSFALSPYANVVSTNLSTVERTRVGGVTSTSTGTLKALNLGLSLSYIGGVWECTDRSGQKFKIKRGNYRAIPCLNEVEDRLRRERPH